MLTSVLFACPTCPDFSSDPLGWLRFRFHVAAEFDTIEWWHRENLLFVTALLVLGVLFGAGAVWVAWQAFSSQANRGEVARKQWRHRVGRRVEWRA